MDKQAYPSLDALKEMSATLGRDRWREVSDVAQVVASYLCCHPKVEEVRYAGLKADPLFSRAATTLERGFGPVVMYRVVGEWHSLVCVPEDPRAAVMRLEQALAPTDSLP